MKKLIAVLLLIVALLPLLSPKPIPPRSKAFCKQAIYADLPYHSEWDTRALNPQETEEINVALSQPFHYLGSGGQCYTFASQDEKYVIKFFKQKAFSIPYWIEHYPIPFLVQWIREKKTIKKEQHRDKVFTAFKLSFDHLLQETGLLYVHLNRTSHLDKTLILNDANGATHQLNLDEIEFVLQKKAVVANVQIDQLLAEGNIDGAKEAIDDLLKLNVSLYKKGFRNRDPNLKSNCAFINYKPILIDVGRMVYCEEIKQANNFKKELLRITPGFRRYLSENHPELLNDFDMSVAKIIASE